jgi:hypothetical protein
MRTLPLFFMIAFLFSATVRGEEAAPSVTYDKEQDTLSVTAENSSLKLLLSHIAMQSHVEVLFDDRAERVINMTFENRPLQSALKDLLRGSSYAFRYDKGVNDTTLLIGVRVLPEGGADTGSTQPLLHVAGEAFMHEKNNHVLSAEEQSRQEVYNKRWAARLAEMPAEVREKVTEHARERIAELDKKNEARKARKAEKKAQREQLREERQAKQQQRLDELSPEERALIEQRREKVKNMATMGQ